MSVRNDSKIRRIRRVQLKLSTHNRLVLLATCVVALSGLIVLYFFNPVQMTQLTGEKGLGVSPTTESGKTTYEGMFREIGPRYNLDWRLLAQLAYQESRLTPLAVGKKNEKGLMQIMPATWEEWAAKVGVSDPFDPYSNVLVAAAYLAFLREYFGEKGYPEDHWMLVAYNWGPDNLRQLLENGGDWNRVPEKRRRYALDILQSAAEMPPGWEEIRDEVVFRTFSP